MAKLNFNIAVVFVYFTFFSIFASVGAVNLLIYQGLIRFQNGQSEPTVVKLDPDKIYQNGIPTAPYSTKSFQTLENVYVFDGVITFGGVDMSSTLQYRDWNLLCESNDRVAAINGKETNSKEFVCKVEDKR